MNAQNKRAVDSLKKVIATSKNDSLRCDAMQELCYWLYDYNFSEAIKYGEAGIKLAEKLNDTNLICRGFDRMASAYDQINKHKEAQQFFLKIIAIRSRGKNLKLLANSENNIGLSYYAEGKLDSSLYWHLKSLDLRIQSGSPLEIAQSYTDIGLVYSAKKNFSIALQYHRNAFTLKKSVNDIRGVSLSLHNIGTCFLDVHNYDSALIYFNEAIRNAKLCNWVYIVHSSYINIARVYVAQKKYDQALSYLKKVADAPDIKENISSQVDMFSALADAYNGKKEYDKAIIYAQKGIEQKNKGNDNRFEPLIACNKALAFAYEQKGDAKKALAFLKKHKLYNDSLLSNNNLLNRNELAAKFESDEKEQSIHILNKENQLKDILIAKSRIKISIYIIALVISFAIIIAILFFYFSKRKMNKQLAEGNKIISETLHERNILLEEMHHRVKNNLQIISGLLTLQSRKTKDSKALEAINEGRDRIKSMMLIHENLYSDENAVSVNAKIYFEELIKSLFYSYNIKKDEIILSTAIDLLYFDIDTLVPLGLILNELISNALKYAFDDCEKGILIIRLKKEHPYLLLEIKDNGKGLPVEFNYENSKSLGFQIIKSFAISLNAEIKIDGTNGTFVQLKIANFKESHHE